MPKNTKKFTILYLINKRGGNIWQQTVFEKKTLLSNRGKWWTPTQRVWWIRKKAISKISTYEIEMIDWAVRIGERGRAKGILSRDKRNTHICKHITCKIKLVNSHPHFHREKCHMEPHRELMSKYLIKWANTEKFLANTILH